VKVEPKDNGDLLLKGLIVQGMMLRLAAADLVLGQIEDMKKTLKQIVRFDPDGKDPASIVALDCLARSKVAEARVEELKKQANGLHGDPPTAGAEFFEKLRKQKFFDDMKKKHPPSKGMRY
jgi:hypothetical protein